MDSYNIIIIVACIFAILLTGKIFLFPMKKIMKLIINSILGGLLIYIINLIGGIWGFNLGLNIITSIFVGILGVPGAIV